MPGIPLRRRRSDESEDEQEPSVRSGDLLSDPGTPRSSAIPPSSKRARLNVSHERSNGELGNISPEESNSVQDHAITNGESGTASVTDQYQPGSIVRVRLQNFVTYTSAEFFPGPNLNMIIGPNGTGKSTLVCAICLGLGWGPQHLGRAKELSEYVKHGFHEAIIEIELARRPEDQELNPVIRRSIKREGSKSQFSINGKQCTLKSVLDLAKSFSIQIDNLCQFLPQDKVCEFAALTPVELLHSTQRAAAPEYMSQWHDELKQHRAEEKRIQAQHLTDEETLANLEGRQQILRADVERLQERANIQKRISMLEKARPFAKYRQARNRHAEAKKRSKEAQAELKKLEDELEPSLRAVNHKQTYTQQVENVVKYRRRAMERAETAADDLVQKQKEMGEKITDLETEIQAEKEGDRKRKGELARIDLNIKKLEKQMSDVTMDFDPLVYNEQIREKHRAIRELQVKGQEVRETARNNVQQGREKNERIARAQKELNGLDSQAGQQIVKLRELSRETAQAWEWIQQNQDQFEHRVYGPPIVECSVKDPKYVDVVEALLQKNDLLTFTTQSRSDYMKLGDHLYQNMKLAEINIRTITTGLDQFRPPVSEEQMRRYGFDGWALDFISGPEPVLAMLCSECRLHQTGVSLRDISTAQYEALQNSAVSSWVTGKASYQITRRREYGPGATSTRVRDVRRGRIWTNQPVDMRAKRELQMNIEGWSEEMRELKNKAEEANEKLQRLREEVDAIEREKKELEDEKSAKQRAYAEYKALPTKLAQEQEKYAALDKAGSELKERLATILEKINQQTLEKGRVALAYAQRVEELEQSYEYLFEAEAMLIEANSDLEALTERNRAVNTMLLVRRREVEQVKKESQEAANIGRQLLDECQRILSEEGGEEQREFMSNQPENQTPEDVENEIESEQARLEIIHEGNPNAMTEYENRQRTISKLRERVAKREETLSELSQLVHSIRQKWEPELDDLVSKISEAFSQSFNKIGCAGQVGVHKDEDFDQWSIQIQVKFRENEPLTILDSHRQSGGERAVSTIFYLLSLQSLARAPFRVVDEINQGMDPRNERVVHDRLLDIACNTVTAAATQDGNARSQSQYFLITPKLLHGLRYHPRMRVLCVASGEYMPAVVSNGSDGTSARGGRGQAGGRSAGAGVGESGAGKLDFGKLVERRKGMMLQARAS